ncbi:MAG: S46 family peptidase [Bacteroidota bacterium]
MKKVFKLMLAFLLILQVNVKADEGMWLLSLIQNLNIDEMQAMGFELSADQIYSINNASLKDAVGALDYGSCTAELVSSEGLILTNHHCGYDEIQYHSSVEHDYLKDGFWAMSREEELPNEGKTISFLVKMSEVTDQVLAGITDDMSEGKRQEIIRTVSGKLEDEAIEGTHYEAYVRAMFNGNRYFLFVMETFRDVRLVGAPPESIGKFGADTDNWMWPRHTGDFSMFRVYTAPDGSPADYSPENIPLKPKNYLKVSLGGYNMDDFAMVMGFPGSTDRYMTSWEVKDLLEVEHPNRIKIRGIRQDIMMEDMQKDAKIRIQYASKYSRSSNYWKYSIGQSKGLIDLNVVAKKEGEEKAFTDWLMQDPVRQATYGEALGLIRDAVEGRKPYENAYQYISECLLRGMESTMWALNFRDLNGVLSDPDYNEEQLKNVVDDIRAASADFFKDYNMETDRKITIAMLKLIISDLGEEYQPEVVKEIKTKYKGNVEKYVDNYFKKTVLLDEAKMNVFLDNPKKAVLEKDPVFVAANSIVAKVISVRGGLMKYNDQFSKGIRLYLAGRIEMQPDHEFYPDANSTMRLTYGKVGDYVARDAVRYSYYTTLKGVMEKEDPDNYEFVVADKLKDLYNKKDFGPYAQDGEMRVCFTTNNDITGGNSGSPVMNKKGELIGIAFDGNWEAMSGDVAFEPELQKCICVDIRYVLFVIDKFAGASHLVDEMTLVR